MHHYPAAAIGLDGKATVLGRPAMIKKTGAAFLSIKLLVLCIVMVISCLGWNNTAKADDASAITGWHEFQFGMTYDDAVKYCQKGSKYSFEVVGSGYPNYAQVYDCEDASIGPNRFLIDLEFTPSGYLYQIILLQYDKDNSSIILGDLDSQYGEGDTYVGQDRIAYCWPAESTQYNACGSAALTINPDQDVPYRLIYTGHEIYYSANTNSFDQWSSLPQVLQPPGTGGF